MAVTTKLTWNEEMNLQKLLGNASLSLLYKSSVHGFDISDLLQKCSYQGPTVTIIYSRLNSFGVFIFEHYPKLYEDFGKPKHSFCFLFPRTSNTAMPTFFFDSPPDITNEELNFFSCREQAFSLKLKSKKLFIGLSACKQLNVRSWHEVLECEVLRVEGIKDDPGNIGKINGVTQYRENLLTNLRTYKPIANLVPEIRILLVGPIGSGKSSFLNSVKSVFRGRMTQQAIAGSEITGITEQYRIYSVKNEEDGKYLPFTFCDSMGLGEKEGVGLCMEDIPYILKGCVPNRYQFNPRKAITPNHPDFITSPLPKDRIHCVVYVLDVNSIENISSRMVSKLKTIQKEVLKHDNECQQNARHSYC
ncbi:interferon-induced protein 44-like isoform X2 [Tamandua tetradactyla]|uniref:interferon-induced protein 44-like isoform X2 n=1 Tax=Tamandua tetradactyla TaxID=48850 RepID=UPI00405439E4